MLTLIRVLRTSLATEKFETSMSKCFEDVGLAPCRELSTESDDVFKVYTAHKRGSLNPNLWKPEFCVPANASLADVVDQQDDMQIVTRLDAEDDPDADDDDDANDDDDARD